MTDQPKIQISISTPQTSDPKASDPKVHVKPSDMDFAGQSPLPPSIRQTLFLLAESRARFDFVRSQWRDFLKVISDDLSGGLP